MRTCPGRLRLFKSSLAFEWENHTILPVMESWACKFSSVKNFMKNNPAARGDSADWGTMASWAKLSLAARIDWLVARVVVLPGADGEKCRW